MGTRRPSAAKRRTDPDVPGRRRHQRQRPSARVYGNASARNGASTPSVGADRATGSPVAGDVSGLRVANLNLRVSDASAARKNGRFVRACGPVGRIWTSACSHDVLIGSLAQPSLRVAGVRLAPGVRGGQDAIMSRICSTSHRSDLRTRSPGLGLTGVLRARATLHRLPRCAQRR